MTYKRTIPRICEMCGTSFMAVAGNVNRGGAQYCTFRCSMTSRVKSVCPKCGSPKTLRRMDKERNPTLLRCNPCLIEANRRWRERNRDRVATMDRSSKAVDAAIKRGDLVRPTSCEGCGTSGGKIEGAHYDYSRPLDLRWLCVSCHRRWDYETPKSLSKSNG